MIRSRCESKKWIVLHDQRFRPLLFQCFEFSLDISFGVRVQDKQTPAQRLRRRLHLLSLEFGVLDIWIQEQRNGTGARHQFANQIQPLSAQFTGEETEARQIAARSIIARSQTHFHRIVTDYKNHRYARRGALCCSRRRFATAGQDRGNLEIDELFGERRQLRVSSLRPTEDNGNVLSFDEAGFAQAAAECGSMSGRFVRRSTAEESDNRHRRRLRSRNERRCNRATNQCEESAPSHVSVLARA